MLEYVHSTILWMLWITYENLVHDQLIIILSARGRDVQMDVTRAYSHHITSGRDVGGRSKNIYCTNFFFK